MKIIMQTTNATMGIRSVGDTTFLENRCKKKGKKQAVKTCCMWYLLFVLSIKNSNIKQCLGLKLINFWSYFLKIQRLFRLWAHYT
jgi:hypothetical protein